VLIIKNGMETHRKRNIDLKFLSLKEFFANKNIPTIVTGNQGQ
jgi:hypothetical protein